MVQHPESSLPPNTNHLPYHHRAHTHTHSGRSVIICSITSVSHVPPNGFRSPKQQQKTGAKQAKSTPRTLSHRSCFPYPYPSLNLQHDDRRCLKKRLPTAPHPTPLDRVARALVLHTSRNANVARFRDFSGRGGLATQMQRGQATQTQNSTVPQMIVPCDRITDKSCPGSAPLLRSRLHRSRVPLR